jgi:hypothetical protein
MTSPKIERSARAVTAAITCAWLVAAPMTRAASPITGALGETKPLIDFRLRYENVDQLATPALLQANATTFRARLGFETGKAWNTALLVEGEAVQPINPGYRADPAVPGVNAGYAVVADPEDQELNRLQLTNTSLTDTTITLGRQRIVLDDHRFVGNVAWRQNEQTFDALRVVNRHIPNVVIDLTYAVHANRIYGPDSPQSPYSGDLYFGNLAWQTKIGKLTGFSYLLGFNPITTIAAGLNPARVATSTYGLRFAGERPVGKIKLGYIASYAEQRERGANPFKIDNHYGLLELNATWRQFTLGGGDEILSGYLVPGTTTSVGFATPLATLHKFQGWTDKFLTTPANGIDDRYATLTWLKKGIGPFDTLTAIVAWHDYTAERVSGDYGEEWNASLAAKYQRITTTVKYGDYQADAGTPIAVARDTSKFWLQLDFVW